MSRFSALGNDLYTGRRRVDIVGRRTVWYLTAAVLIGLSLVGLLGRGASPVQATVWATHVHAAAGDVLAARWGRIGYLADEVTAELPHVLRSLGAG